jgi:DNA-binding HxlR family transcriptional regulator
MVRYGRRDYQCTLELAFDVVGGKWQPRILWWLGHGTLRFRALERQLPDSSRKVLVQQLRRLESDGLVRRTVHAEVPPRVEHALSEAGRRLLPVLDALDASAGELVAAGRPGPAPVREPN